MDDLVRCHVVCPGLVVASIRATSRCSHWSKEVISLDRESWHMNSGWTSIFQHIVLGYGNM